MEELRAENPPGMRAVLAWLAEDEPEALDLALADGRTPLFSAAWAGEVQNVTLLLDRGADPNRPTVDGWTPLHAAASQGHADVARALLAAGANPNVRLSFLAGAPLNMAAAHGHTAVAKVLLEHGANPDIANADGWTLLHAAVWHGQTEMAAALVAHGADVNATDRFGRTPLDAAILQGHHRIAEKLLEAGGRQNFTADLPYADIPPELKGPLRPLSSEEHTALLQTYGETLSGLDQAESMLLLKKMLDVLAEDEAERFLELHAKGMVDISQAEIEERARLQQKALSRLSQADRQRIEALGIKAVGVHRGGSADERAGTLMGVLSAEEVAEMQRLMDKSLSLLSERDSMRLLQLHRLFRGEGSRQITQKEWQEMHALNKKAVGLLSAEEQARFQKLMLKAAGFSKGARQEGHSESP